MTPEVTIYNRGYGSYTVDFFCCNIDVTVTSSPAVLREWLSTTLYLRRNYVGRLVVGLGVQWNPFPQGSCSVEADTLQLCVGSRCLIFQLSQAPAVPVLLRRFLTDTNNTFVGIWNGSDEDMLWMSRHQLEIHRLLDLRRYLTTDDGQSLARDSFETIVDEYLGYSGVSLDKEISMSEWDAEVLSHEQVLQACVDAHVAFEIGKNIRAWEL